MPQAQLTVDPHFAVGRVNRRLSVPSSSISVAVSTTGSTSPATRSPTTMFSAPTCSSWSASWGVDHPLPRRQLRLRLPLGGRDRSQRGPADPPRPGLGTRRSPTRWGSTSSPAGSRRPAASSCTTLNLGTRGVQEALDVLEYSNVPSGAELSDLRIKNGRVRPHAIKYGAWATRWTGPGSSATGARTITANSRRGRRRQCGSSTPHWSWWFAEAPTPTCRPSGPGSTRSSSTPTRTSTTLLPRLL